MKKKIIKKLSPIYEITNSRFIEREANVSYFPEKKFLNYKKILFSTLKKEGASKYSKYRKKKKIFYSKYSLKKQWYISNYWQKYLHLCKIQNDLDFRKKYIIFKKWYHKFFNILYGVDRLDVNPYEAFKRLPQPWMRQTFFDLSPLIYQKYPWLEGLIFKRKVYRITRDRPFKRYKNPFDEQNFFFYRKWLWLSNKNKGLVRKTEIVGDRIFKKYLFLPFYNFTKKSFKNKIKQLQKVYKPSYGNYIRTYFNHRLRFLTQDLNIVPLTNWVPHLVNFRDTITVSNSKVCSLHSEDKHLYVSQVLSPAIKTLPFRSVKYVNLASKINSSFSINKKITKKSLVNPLENGFVLSKKETLIKKNFHQNYKVEYGEILHVTSSFQKYKNFFFLRELSKKRIPHNFKLDTNKTAAYMIRTPRSVDTSRTHRVSDRQWTTAVLQIKN